MAGDNNNGTNGGAADRLRGFAAVIVAIVLLLGFAALLIYLVGKAGTAADGTWSRYVYLFGAVEALVFTAVGWLFGREVNRQAVQSAEARADQATSRTEEATAKAAEQEAKGHALAAAIEARATGPGAPGVEERSFGGSAADGGQLRDLAELARALFPGR